MSQYNYSNLNMPYYGYPATNYINGVSDPTPTNYFAQPAQIAAVPSTNQPVKKKKVRNLFKDYQIKQMEDLFKANRSPQEIERRQLAMDIGLTPKQVKIWFQNRRYKEKTMKKADAKKPEQHDDDLPTVSAQPQKENGPPALAPTGFQSNFQWYPSYAGQYQYQAMYDQPTAMPNQMTQNFTTLPVAQQFNTMNFNEHQNLYDMGLTLNSIEMMSLAEKY